MRPVSIVIVLSATAFFIIFFNDKVFADKLKEENDELKKELKDLKNENQKLKDGNQQPEIKKKVKKTDKKNEKSNKIKDLKNHKKVEKKEKKNEKQKTDHKKLKIKTDDKFHKDKNHVDKEIKKYLQDHQMEDGTPKKFNLSIQLNESKALCWNVDTISKRIVNGTNSRRKESTYMAAVFRKLGALDTEYVCGGCIISSLYILTAGNCFFNKSHCDPKIKNESYTIRCGMHDLSSKDFFEFDVQQIFVNPNFTCHKDAYFSDIAVVKLTTSITYSDRVSPCCLPGLTTPKEWDIKTTYKAVLLAGWGRIIPDFNRPLTRINEILQEGRGYILDNTVCMQEFVVIKKKKYVAERSYCIGAKRGSARLCEGDQGSPIVPIVDPNLGKVDYPIALGVVSFGDDLRCNGLFLASRVDKYLDWINDVTKH